MKSYLAIFRKDLKSVSGLLMMTYILALIILVGNILFENLYFMLPIPFSQLISIGNFMGYSNMTILFLFPVILTYSLNAEWLSGARFQRLFLPVRPSSFLLVKFTVICVAAELLHFLYVYIYGLPYGPLVAWIAHRFYGVDVANLQPWRLKQLGPLTPSWFDYLTIPFTRPFAFEYFTNFYFLSNTVLYSGLVCFAQAVSIVFRLYRFAAWVFAFLAGLAIYSVCRETFSVWRFDYIHHESASFITGFPLIGGLIFLAASLVLFEKYAEV